MEEDMRYINEQVWLSLGDFGDQNPCNREV